MKPAKPLSPPLAQKVKGDAPHSKHRDWSALHRRYSSDRRLRRGAALLAERSEVEVEF